MLTLGRNGAQTHWLFSSSSVVVISFDRRRPVRSIAPLLRSNCRPGQLSFGVRQKVAARRAGAWRTADRYVAHGSIATTATLVLPLSAAGVQPGHHVRLSSPKGLPQQALRDEQIHELRLEPLKPHPDPAVRAQPPHRPPAAGLIDPQHRDRSRLEQQRLGCG